MTVIFLGGMLLPAQLPLIETASRLYVENAANALQKGFVDGIQENTDEPFKILNLPFIGSYPQAYRKAVFRGLGTSHFRDVELCEPNFINVRFLRIASRFLAAFAGLFSLGGRRSAVIIYSVHLPFLCAAAAWKALRPGSTICLIIPDLPEHVGAGGGRWRRVVIRLQKWLFRKLLPRVDSFVLLTDAMAARLGIKEGQYTVVEGMVEASLVVDTPLLPSSCCDGNVIFLYTGTLERRYGLTDLLDAFRSIDSQNIRLWVCGSGPDAADVEFAARCDGRITFFARVPQEKARELQRKATALVNPRPPGDEFTKYSFPSKTIEYMAAGRPIIMHSLPGIPAEYLPFMEIPSTPDTAGLAASMIAISRMEPAARDNLGKSIREFVLSNKTPAQQCKRVLDLIRKDMR